jgi:hypothetical protein
MPSGKANAGGTTFAPPRPQPRRDDPRMAQGVSLRRIPKNGTASLWGCAHRRLVLATLKLANGVADAALEAPVFRRSAKRGVLISWARLRAGLRSALRLRSGQTSRGRLSPHSSPRMKNKSAARGGGCTGGARLVDIAGLVRWRLSLRRAALAVRVGPAAGCGRNWDEDGI